MKRPILIFSAILADLFVVPAVFPAEKTPVPEHIARPDVVYKAEGLRDPFQNPLTEASKPAAKPEGAAVAERHAPPSLSVQGLIWGGNIPQAIVNNKVVKVGDAIDGARVISIDKNGITVLFEETEYKFSPQTAGAKSSKNP